MNKTKPTPPDSGVSDPDAASVSGADVLATDEPAVTDTADDVAELETAKREEAYDPAGPVESDELADRAEAQADAAAAVHELRNPVLPDGHPDAVRELDPATGDLIVPETATDEWGRSMAPGVTR
jgi:hypothetical protein